MATNGNVVCSAGYGTARYYCRLPAANDALVVIILQSGHQDDLVLRDHVSLQAMLAVTQNRECTALNYQRQSFTNGATEAVDDGNNRVDSILTNVTFPNLGAMSGTNANQVQAAAILCYQADRTTATDATTLPIAKYCFPFVADGSDRTVPFSTGFLRSTGGA